MTRYILSTLVPKWETRWSVLRLHVIPFVCIVVLIFGFYYLSRYVAPGWLSYAISTLCLVFIGVTALARVNDIPHENTAIRWQVRRFGLILVGAACIGLVFAPFASRNGVDGPDFPAWRQVMLHMGVMFTWMTTPMMPPWHRYISGEFRKLRMEVPAGVEVQVVQSNTVANGSMFEEKRKGPTVEEDGP